MKTFTFSTIGIELVFVLAITQSGCTNVLGFGTATKFGLDVTQRADQTVDVTMGYDRTEVASIPAPKNQNARLRSEGKAGEDTYSVLGTFKVRYDSPFNNEPLVLDQLFATGGAARAAAKDPSMQAYFGRQARDIAEKSPSNGETATAAEPAAKTKEVP